MAVRAPPIRPPVQDSAVDRVFPMLARRLSRASASERGVVPTSGDVSEPSDPVYVVHHFRDGFGHERPPFLLGDDPAADLGAGIDVAVVEGRCADFEPGLLEQALGERIVGVHAPEGRRHRNHLGYPDGIAVQIFHRDDAVVVDSRVIQGILDHQISLAGGERIVRVMGILGASDSDDEMVRL